MEAKLDEIGEAITNAEIQEVYDFVISMYNQALEIEQDGAQSAEVCRANLDAG